MSRPSAPRYEWRVSHVEFVPGRPNRSEWKLYEIGGNQILGCWIKETDLGYVITTATIGPSGFSDQKPHVYRSLESAQRASIQSRLRLAGRRLAEENHVRLVLTNQSRKKPS